MDDADVPAEDSWGLLVPFTCVNSRGGPFDDDAFVAGMQVGQADRALQMLAASNADHASWTTVVDARVVDQLELLAMHRGFPVLDVVYPPGSEGWAQVTFRTAKELPWNA